MAASKNRHKRSRFLGRFTKALSGLLSKGDSSAAADTEQIVSSVEAPQGTIEELPTIDASKDIEPPRTHDVERHDDEDPPDSAVDEILHEATEKPDAGAPLGAKSDIDQETEIDSVSSQPDAKLLAVSIASPKRGDRSVAVNVTAAESLASSKAKAEVRTSVTEWAESQKDVCGKLIMCLLDGMTQSQAAKECNIPAKAVEPLLSYGLKRIPAVREDAYSYAFKTYAMTLDEFIDIFGQPAKTYRYLSLTCQQGSGGIESMMNDPNISESAKINLRNRIKYQKPADTSDTSSKARSNADAGQSLKTGSIIQSKASGAKTRSVANKSSIQVTKKATRTSSQRSSGTRTESANLGELGRKRLHDEISACASNGTEYSTDYFFEKLPGLMDDLQIFSKANLYELMKDAFAGDWDVTFHENRIVRFGDANRERQILSLLEKESPIKLSDFAKKYLAFYGVDVFTVRNWLKDYLQYNRSGVLDIKYGRSNANRKIMKRDGESPTYRFNGLLHAFGAIDDQEYKQLSDERYRSSLSGTKGRAERSGTIGKTPTGGSTGVTGASRQTTPAIPKRTKPQQGSNIRSATMTPGNLRTTTKDLADAVRAIAKDGTEYSTTYFLRRLPKLAKELGVGEKRDKSGVSKERQFYNLFRRAFEGDEYVTFPSGFFVRFGAVDRERQIIELLEEMSPVSASDLRREYEKRYGVSQSTLYGWFKCIYRYRKGEIYSIDGTRHKTTPNKVAQGKSEESTPLRESRVFSTEMPLQDRPKTSTPKALSQNQPKPPVPKALSQNQPKALVAQPSLSKARAEEDYELVKQSIRYKKVKSTYSRKDLERVRAAIDKLSRDGTEYSTNYFYFALPGLVTRLGSPKLAEFNYIVVAAYEGCSHVKFTSGNVMRFGDTSRERQMLSLMEELSPVSPIDLAIAYEERYGFSRYLVRSWYREFSEYEENGQYVYRPSALEKLSATCEGEEAQKSEAPISKQSEQVTSEVRNDSRGETKTPTDTARRATEAGDDSRIAMRTPKRAKEHERQPGFKPIAAKVTTTLTEPAGHTPAMPDQVTALEWASTLKGKNRRVVQQILDGKPLIVVADDNGIGPDEASYILFSEIGKCPIVREDAFLDKFRQIKSKWDFCARTGEPESTFIFLYWKELALRSKDVPKTKSNSAAKGANKPHPTTESRSAVVKRVAREVDKLAKNRKEYAVGHFYTSLSPFLSECGVRSEQAFVDLLKIAYKHDEGVELVEGDILRFGKCDRKVQLKSLLWESPYISRGAFVAEYSRRYGFDASRIAGWLSEYGIEFPSEKSKITSHSAQTRMDMAGEARLTQAKTQERDKARGTTKPHQVTAQPQMAMNLDAVHPAYTHTPADYDEFLRGELNADCCDRRLVVERFRARFPKGPNDPFNEGRLKRLGYRAKGKKLLFREGVGFNDYFTKLISSRTLFARGDEGFENVVFNDPTFRQILRKKMRAFEVVEYERDSFISTDHLCKQMDVTIDEIRSYSQDVVGALRKAQGVAVPFTIWSLKHVYHIGHPLDKLVNEGGMSSYLFETLFDIDPKVQCCTIGKKRAFLETMGPFDAANFIECLVEMNGPMGTDDLLDLLKDSYGIDYLESSLRRTISVSSLYYDDITESVYNSRLEWEEMVNRELA